MKKYWLKELVCFWWRNHDCVSIVTELCEEFSRRVLLNIFYRISPHFFPWKRPILWHTAILFLHGKAFTERGVRFLMVQLGLCVDCYRIMRGIQQKGFLKHFLQNFSPPLPVKTADFMTLPFCFFMGKHLQKEVFDFWWCNRIVHWLLQNYVRFSIQGFS